MAKGYVNKRQHQTGRTITTKTPYGSTGDMVVTDDSILSKIQIDENCLLLKDDDGYYITMKNRVDNGLADPMRYCEKARRATQHLSEEVLSDEDK